MKQEINSVFRFKAGSPLNVPEEVYATLGSFKGEVNLQWDAVERARQYVIQVAAGNSGKWRQVDIICSPNYMLDGLQPGRTYLFRVSAVFKEGQGPWSKAVSKKL